MTQAEAEEMVEKSASDVPEATDTQKDEDEPTAQHTAAIVNPKATSTQHESTIAQSEAKPTTAESSLDDDENIPAQGTITISASNNGEKNQTSQKSNISANGEKKMTQQATAITDATATPTQTESTVAQSETKRSTAESSLDHDKNVPAQGTVAKSASNNGKKNHTSQSPNVAVPGTRMMNVTISPIIYRTLFDVYNIREPQEGQPFPWYELSDTLINIQDCPYLVQSIGFWHDGYHLTRDTGGRSWRQVY